MSFLQDQVQALLAALDAKWGALLAEVEDVKASLCWRLAASLLC